VKWNNQPADGQYTLVARATDRVGNSSDSAPITVTVANGSGSALSTMALSETTVSTSSATETSDAKRMAITEESPTPEATAIAKDTITPISTVTPDDGTGTTDPVASSPVFPLESATALPEGTTTTEEAPEVTATPGTDSQSSNEGAGAVAELSNLPGASAGDVARNDPVTLDIGEPNTSPEASNVSTRRGESVEPDGGTERQRRTDRGDDEPAETGGGDQRDLTTPTDQLEPGVDDRAVDEQPLPVDNDLGAVGTQGRDLGEASLAAGDKERDGTAESDDGDRADRRNEPLGTHEPDGNPEPDAHPNSETASPSPQDDRPARGDTRNSAAKATRTDDPGAGELSENWGDTRGTASSIGREPEGSATPPETTRENTPSRPSDTALGTGDAPGQEVTRPGGHDSGGHRGPRAGKRAEPVSQSDDGGAKAYRIIKTRQSPHAGDAAVVVDDDPATSWSTEPGATPHEAYLLLDLGTSRSIGRVRWLGAPEGLSGTLRIEVSTDGKRWNKLAGVAQNATDTWQELWLKQSVDAQYVRFTFTNPTGEPRLGGLAEVEIRPAGKGEAKGSDPKQDRHLGKLGHATAKPGHERAKSGKQQTGDNNQTGGKDQQGSKGQTAGDNNRNKTQDPEQDQAKPGQQRKPDQEQGKERNKGQERRKETAKSSHKRAHRGRGS
jgi:hypothetical protein